MTFILIFLTVFCAIMAIGYLSNAQKWETKKTSAAKNKKIGVCLAIITIALIIISIIFFNSNSSDYEYKDTPTYNNQNNHKDYSDGDYYENYDYDDDGEINQNEWEDALGDYMDKIMN